MIVIINKANVIICCKMGGFMRKNSLIDSDAFEIILITIDCDKRMSFSKFFDSSDGDDCKKKKLKILSNYISKNSCIIKSLLLSDNDFNLEDLLVILPSMENSKISFLDLSNNNFTNEEFNKFVKIIKDFKNFKLINFANNSIDIYGMVKGVKTLLQNYRENYNKEHNEIVKFLWGDYELTNKEYEFLHYEIEKDKNYNYSSNKFEKDDKELLGNDGYEG